jgi:hypothetical protein
MAQLALIVMCRWATTRSHAPFGGFRHTITNDTKSLLCAQAHNL